MRILSGGAAFVALGCSLLAPTDEELRQPRDAGGSSAGGTSGTAGAGTGGTVACVLPQGVECPGADEAKCECLGCNGVCADRSGPRSDCVCEECWNDPTCTVCHTDGQCDPFGEYCGCPDCEDHPSCANYN